MDTFFSSIRTAYYSVRQYVRGEGMDLDAFLDQKGPNLRLFLSLSPSSSEYSSSSSSSTTNNNFVDSFELPRDADRVRQLLCSRGFVFPYRKGFVPGLVAERGLTTDQGWGCMLRVTQMFLAQAIVSSTRTNSKDFNNSELDSRSTNQLLSLFADNISDSARVDPSDILTTNSNNLNHGGAFGVRAFCSLYEKKIPEAGWQLVRANQRGQSRRRVDGET